MALRLQVLVVGLVAASELAISSKCSKSSKFLRKHSKAPTQNEVAEMTRESDTSVAAELFIGIAKDHLFDSKVIPATAQLSDVRVPTGAGKCGFTYADQLQGHTAPRDHRSLPQPTSVADFFFNKSRPCAYWVGKGRQLLLDESSVANLEEVIPDRPGPGTPDANYILSKGHTVAELHFDQQHNFLTQVSGRKRVELLAPSRLPLLPLYPYLHQSWRQAKTVVTGKMDVTVDIAAGDVLYIPPYTLHRITSLEDTSISLSVMWGSDAAALSMDSNQLDLGLQPFWTDKVLSCAAVRFTQKLLSGVGERLARPEEYDPWRFVARLHAHRWSSIDNMGSRHRCWPCGNVSLADHTAAIDAAAEANAALLARRSLQPAIIANLVGDRLDSVAGFVADQQRARPGPRVGPLVAAARAVRCLVAASPEEGGDRAVPVGSTTGSTKVTYKGTLTSK